MRVNFSAPLRTDLESAVNAAFSKSRIIDVTYIARSVQRRNWEENVALEDIEQHVVSYANYLGAGVVFDSLASESSD